MPEAGRSARSPSSRDACAATSSGIAPPHLERRQRALRRPTPCVAAVVVVVVVGRRPQRAGWPARSTDRPPRRIDAARDPDLNGARPPGASPPWSDDLRGDARRLFLVDRRRRVRRTRTRRMPARRRRCRRGAAAAASASWVDDDHAADLAVAAVRTPAARASTDPAAAAVDDTRVTPSPPSRFETSPATPHSCVVPSSPVVVFWKSASESTARSLASCRRRHELSPALARSAATAGSSVGTTAPRLLRDRRARVRNRHPDGLRYPDGRVPNRARLRHRRRLPYAAISALSSSISASRARSPPRTPPARRRRHDPARCCPPAPRSCRRRVKTPARRRRWRRRRR